MVVMWQRWCAYWRESFTLFEIWVLAYLSAVFASVAVVFDYNYTGLVFLLFSALVFVWALVSERSNFLYGVPRRHPEREMKS